MENYLHDNFNAFKCVGDKHLSLLWGLAGRYDPVPALWAWNMLFNIYFAIKAINHALVVSWL